STIRPATGCKPSEPLSLKLCSTFSFHCWAVAQVVIDRARARIAKAFDPISTLLHRMMVPRRIRDRAGTIFVKVADRVHGIMSYVRRETLVKYAWCGLTQWLLL